MKPILDEAAVGSLLEWFTVNGVSHPWSRTTDPWAVWVSEVMLQQTTVAAAGPRYLRWMDRFPQPESLADADDEEILREWEGLGYYSRARNLAAAARAVRDSHGGRIPGDYAGLKELPGVGDYTAAAVASFCHGERRAALDANGRRIGCRLTARRKWDAALETRFRRDVETLMPVEKPGNLNAALMQLGQLVCKPSSPDCRSCPLAAGCLARSRGLQDRIPARKRPEIVRKTTKLALPVADGTVLLRRRTEGIGRGLWVFPAADEIEGLEDWIPAEELPSYIHAYTRYRETLLPRIYRPPGEGKILPRGLSGTWCPLCDLDERPMPTAYRKVARDLAARACTSTPEPR